MAEVLEFLDFRLFLKAALARSGAGAKRWTQRSLHALMGVPASSGFLANVLAGRKNLTPEHVRCLAEAFGLPETSRAYFELLVAYGQEKDVARRNGLLLELFSLRKSALTLIAPDQLGIFSQWHYVALYELLSFHPFRGDFKALAKQLDPPVSVADLRKAITTLRRMGLLREEGDGCLRPTEPSLSTGDEVFSRDLAQYQLDTMDLGKRALTTVPHTDRDISVVTLALSREGYEEAKGLLQQVRKQLLEISERDKKKDRVYHCGLQLFPMTRQPEGDS